MSAVCRRAKEKEGHSCAQATYRYSNITTCTAVEYSISIAREEKAIWRMVWNTVVYGSTCRDVEYEELLLQQTLEMVNGVFKMENDNNTDLTVKGWCNVTDALTFLSIKLLKKDTHQMKWWVTCTLVKHLHLHLFSPPVILILVLQTSNLNISYCWISIVASKEIEKKKNLCFMHLTCTHCVFLYHLFPPKRWDGCDYKTMESDPVKCVTVCVKLHSILSKTRARWVQKLYRARW